MIKIKKYEIISAVSTIIIGTLLHFVFNWSGRFVPLALVAAVNESTWEHLKMAFWPAFVFAVVGYFRHGKSVRKYIGAQTVKLATMPLLIIILFYGWHVFFQDSLIYDIIVFMVSVLAGHYIAYKIQLRKGECKNKLIFIIISSILLLMFSLFTFFAPNMFLFKDPEMGTFGISDARSSKVNNDVLPIIYRAPDQMAVSPMPGDNGILNANSDDNSSLPYVVFLIPAHRVIKIGAETTLKVDLVLRDGDSIISADWTGEGTFSDQKIEGNIVSAIWKSGSEEKTYSPTVSIKTQQSSGTGTTKIDVRKELPATNSNTNSYPWE